MNGDSEHQESTEERTEQIIKNSKIIMDLLKRDGIAIDDLYEFSEKDVINKILNCNGTYIKESFAKFQNATSVYCSEVPLNNKYCISVKGKKRYIVPLTQNNGKVCRINEIDKVANFVLSLGL